MAIVVASGATPRSFTSGSFVLATLQSGPSWTFTFTPTLVSTDAAYSGFRCLLATNDDGGLYLVNRRIEFYNGSGGGTLTGNGSTLTWSAGQAITCTINLAAGAGASSIVVASATTGNGTSAFTASGTYFTATTLGVGQFSNTGTFTFSGTISAITDGVNSTSGTAANGGVTSSGTMAVTVATSGAAACGGVASTGTFSAPNPSGTSSCGGVTSAGTMAVTRFVSGTAASGGITSVGAMSGGSLWGTQGASGTAQSVNSSQPATGTMTTAFVPRAASTAYAQNARLTNSGRRYHVVQGGTTAAGAGPSTTGQVTDGTATLVAVNGSAATAPSVTTQAANSVIVAAFSRGRWSTDTSSPTDNKGNSYATLESNVYTAFTASRSALAVVANATGGTGHIFSLSYGDLGSAGDEVTGWFVEVPTGRATSFVQARSFVERSAPTGGVVVSSSVTTTGPAMLVAFCLGTGTVLTAGTSHTATVEAAYTPCPDADSLISLTTNGYIQGKAATRYVTGAGTYTATWTTTEGAHLYLVAIQEIAWVSTSGSAACGGITSAGSMLVTASASGAASNGGVSSSGSVLVTTSTAGAAGNGGVASAGTMAVTTFASGASACGGISSAGSVVPAAITVSGSATCGGISSAGVTTLATSGAAAAGGLTSSGAMAISTTTAGAVACGGIGSAGAMAVTVLVAGAAACGGIASSGSLFSPGLVNGASACGSLSSVGAVAVATSVSGTSACGEITSSGNVFGSASVVARPLPARLRISVVGAAPFRMRVE